MPWPILLLIATLKFRRGWCPTALYGQTKSWLLELMDQAGTFLGILNQAINGKCDIMSDVKWNGKAPAPAGSWHSPRLLLCSCDQFRSKQRAITQDLQLCTVNFNSFNQAKDQEKEEFINNTDNTPALCLTATTVPLGLEMIIKYTIHNTHIKCYQLC